MYYIIEYVIIFTYRKPIIVRKEVPEEAVLYLTVAPKDAIEASRGIRRYAQEHMLRLIDKAIPILTEEPFLCNCKCSMPPGQRLKYHIEKMIDPKKTGLFDLHHSVLNYLL